MKKKLIGFDYPDEEVEVRIHNRIAWMGAFLGREEAEDYREEFFDTFGLDVKDGLLVILQDDLVQINNHYVVRIMAESAQQELPLE